MRHISTATDIYMHACIHKITFRPSLLTLLAQSLIFSETDVITARSFAYNKLCGDVSKIFLLTQFCSHSFSRYEFFFIILNNKTVH